LYGEFTADFHHAFFGKETIPVVGRDNKVYKIPAPLALPDNIISRCDEVIARYKAISQSQGLFKPDFDSCWETQKPQIKKYIFDGFQNGIKVFIFIY